MTFMNFSRLLAVTCTLLFRAGWSDSIQAADEVLPRHVTPETLKAVRAGLDYLARTQSEDGAWHEGQGGQNYPVAMTSLACMSMLAHGDSPTRGRYSQQLERGTEHLIKCK